MPGGNRVEELEERVRELEATVGGLTDELVECKVRIRELENAVDADIGLPGVDEEPTEEVEEPETADTDKTEASEGGDEESETDIIVA